MVLGKGNTSSVHLMSRVGGEKKPSALKDLPSDPFELTGIKLQARISPEELASIAGVKRLALLGLYTPSQMSDATLLAFPGSTSVNHFICDSDLVTDQGMAVLDRMPNLSKLAIVQTKVEGPGLVHLKSLRKLTDLEIPAPSAANYFAPLEGLTALNRLRCGGPQFTDEGLKYLQGLPRLETLLLRSATVTNDGLITIGKMHALKEVELAYTKITDSGLASLANLKNLARLDLSYTKVTDAKLDSILPLDKLTFLSLSGTKITDRGLETLSALKSLKALHLRDTALTSSGVAKLKEALPGCTIDWNGTGSALTSRDLDPRAVGATAGLSPGLLMTEYPRKARVQDSNRGGFVPLEELMDPIGTPMPINSLKEWLGKPTRNSVAEGLLKIDQDGDYQFRSRWGGDANALYIDGKLVCEFGDGDDKRSTIHLTRGLVPIASICYVTSKKIDVAWIPPGQTELSEIPTDLLFYPADLKAKRKAQIKAADEARAAKVTPPNPLAVSKYLPGLTVVSYAALAEQKPNPQGDFYVVSPDALGQPEGAPSVVEELSPWQFANDRNWVAFGYLRIEQDGEYGLYTNSGNNHGRLIINGRSLHKTGDGEESVHRVQLKRGLVPVTFIGYVLCGRFIVHWQPPGQAELQPIPHDVLWHDPAKTLPEFP